MDITQKIGLALLLLKSLFPGPVSGQDPLDSNFLQADCTDSISCRISFTMDDFSYREIRESQGSKFEPANVRMVYNGNPIPVKSLSIRGKSSLYYPKKSFTLKLDEKIELKSTHASVRVKDCYLLGLAMDRNYIQNYISFKVMEALDIFHLTFCYGKVIINQITQGIYLIIERPRDYALKKLDSPAIIRRGFDEKIDKLVINNNLPNSYRRLIYKKFQGIYASCRKYSGQTLYDSLDSRIDMVQYMNWLAFNYLIRNGDYTDEIYLYVDQTDNRFRIIPWDYDDIFSQEPHEGNKSRRRVPGGKFIYSSEDRLDRAIITDEYLYARYLEQLMEVIGVLNDPTLRMLLQDVYCAVYPYYLDPAILATTRHDKYGPTNPGELKATLLNELNQFQMIRNDALKELSESVH